MSNVTPAELREAISRRNQVEILMIVTFTVLSMLVIGLATMSVLHHKQDTLLVNKIEISS